jgi:redox-sensitive bicupin YhaK (pirin superfamily)
VAGVTLKAGESATWDLAPGRVAYLVPTLGAVDLDGIRLDPRDGAGVRDQSSLTVTAIDDAEVVLVDAAA